MTGTDARFWKRLPRLYKKGSQGTEWKQVRQGEAAIVVKGTSRRIIVVKSPDPQVFEEAIFVLREDWMQKRSADQVVEEARRAAGEYLRQCAVPRTKTAKRFWCAAAAAGTLGAGILWAIFLLFRV